MLRAALGLCLVGLATPGGLLAFQIPPESRLDERVVPDPSRVTPVVTVDLEALAEGDARRVSWDRFLVDKSGTWRVVLDRASGAPLLVEGSGMPWAVAASEETRPALEKSLRAFVAENRDLLLADDAELVLDRDATGPVGFDAYQVVFAREVRGVPVLGDRYVFTLGQGNLVSFGVSRWTPIDVDTTPLLTASLAAEILAAHTGVPTREAVQVLAAPALRLVPQRGDGPSRRTSALVWQLTLAVLGERGTWVGMVDAHDGRIRAFFDNVRYARVNGGVYPESADMGCPNGCQHPNYPMPYATVVVGGTTVTANDVGLFTCQPAGVTASIDLSSPTVRISDACGPVSESVTCDGDIDLGVNFGANCLVTAGASPGNTKASRSCFYAVNRLKEHARSWLPGNTWLNGVQTTVNTNVNATCNATWDGSSLNMYRTGNNCHNTCDAVGVAAHEWGHGMDQNDGGGFDNSSEAYADISEFLNDHTSCVGRWFFSFGVCSGYGDTCNGCTGIRDMDWDARLAHTPATPAGFVAQRCPSGFGPCGKEEHCEAYVAGEAMWDLATRDLPASGMDQASAWQLVDRLWYQSRQGSGGNMYTCSLPSSSGCGTTTLFSKLRLADLDDGSLADGTPHAAAIFAAFDRHGIACGSAGDSSNQSQTICPALAAPVVTATEMTTQVQLSWAAVPGAASYHILRNDVSCDWSYTAIATVAASTTTYTDTSLANDLQEYYRVQAVGANAACESPLSACFPATPHGPFAVAGTHSLVADACGTGGAGSDGKWDAGEVVKLTVSISNTGSEALTGATGTLTSTLPGIEILDGTAAYPDVAPGGTASTLSPHFTVRLPAGAACGTNVPFDLEIAAAGTTWGGSFGQRLGGSATVSTTRIDEHFDAGIPASWTIVDSGSGTGPGSTWTTANPGGRTFTPPLQDPVAIVDSNFAGSTNSQDEHLITPALDLSAATAVTLQLDHYFRWFDGHNNERADVDVRSSLTSGSWINIYRKQGGSSPDGEHLTLDLSPQLAGATGAQVRFRYALGSNEWWWQVDNIRLDTSGQQCTMTACAPGPEVRPVPDGIVGSPMLASRASADGSVIDVTWDVATCSSPDHEILHGNLAGVATYAVDGGVCGLGASGSTTWSGVPPGDVWFVVVGSDGAGIEGSWGSGPGGAPRKGGDASGQCGNGFRDNGGSCP